MFRVLILGKQFENVNLLHAKLFLLDTPNNNSVWNYKVNKLLWNRATTDADRQISKSRRNLEQQQQKNREKRIKIKFKVECRQCE